ncbi:hypothetical protein [Longispora urticae]
MAAPIDGHPPDLLNSPAHPPRRRERQPLGLVLFVVGLCVVFLAAIGTLALAPRDHPAADRPAPAVVEPDDDPGDPTGPVPTRSGRVAPDNSRQTTGPRTDITGWPGPDTTGVRPGTVLRPMAGTTITVPGTVLEGVDISGCVMVKADDVTIRNSRIRGACSVGTVRTDIDGRTRNTVLEYVEVDGQRRAPTWPLIVGSNYTCHRCDLHGGGSQLHFTDNVTVTESWLHDPYEAGSSHNSAMASHGGGNNVIRGNTLDCGTTGNCSAALALYGNFGPIHDVLVEGNLFSGGSYCLYAGSLPTKPFPVATNVRILGNAFARTPYAKCGHYGPATSWTRESNEWRGNYWNEPGRPEVVDPVTEAEQRAARKRPRALAVAAPGTTSRTVRYGRGTSLNAATVRSA